jgi:hypothetical protein
LDEAIAAARRFSREQPEPGKYYVVQVRRAATPGPLDKSLQRTEGSVDASALGR